MTNTLGDILISFAILYYEADDPAVSDAIYDRLWGAYNVSEEDHPLITTKGEASGSLHYITAKDYLTYKSEKVNE